MSTRQTQYLIKTCAKWSRGVYATGANTYKVSQAQHGKLHGWLSYQFRFLSSSDDQHTKLNHATIDTTDNLTGDTKSQGEQSNWNVFKTIQMEVGTPVSSVPTFKYASKEETQFLNSEMRTLSSDWPELAHMLDGQDMSMEALVTFVEENIASASFTVLCSLMGPYLKVFKKETKQFKLILDEGIHRLSTVSLSEALFFVQALNHLPDEEVDSKYYEICQEKLKTKLTEMVTPVQIVYAMSILKKNKMPELHDMLDNLANKHLSTMSTDSLLDLFHIQAIDKRRNPTLIRNIVVTLNKCDFSKLNIDQLTNVFYACASLSVYNLELLQKTSKQTRTVLKRGKITYKNARQRHSILYSCLVLRWKDDELLQELAYHLERDSSRSLKQFAEDIISLCYLGYKHTSVVRDLFSENGASALKETNKYLWVKYVHALAARRMATLPDIQAALDPQFYSSLVSEDNKKFVRESTRRMLLNLQGCLEVDFGVTDSPLAETDAWIREMEIVRGKNSITYAVETAMKHISPDIKGASIDKYGHKLDFEVMFRVSADTASAYSRVPVGIRVLDFHEMVQGSDKTVTASGPTAMVARHLKARTMPVLLLPYYKWKSHDISLQNAISLETMLNETINPTKKVKKEQKPATETKSTIEAEATENSDNDVAATTKEQKL